MGLEPHRVIAATKAVLEYATMRKSANFVILSQTQAAERAATKPCIPLETPSEPTLENQPRVDMSNMVLPLKNRPETTNRYKNAMT